MKQRKKTRKNNKIIRGGSEAAAALGVGALGGYTLGKKKRRSETWFSHLLGSYLDLVWYLSKSFIKAGTYVYKESVIYSIDYFFGRDITGADYKDLTEEVKEKLILSARMAAQISEDPEAMENLRETGKVSAEIMRDILEEMEEPLEDMTNEAVDMLEFICRTLAAAGIDITIGMIGAALGQIPFLGGLINIIITTGRAFNDSMKAVSNTGKSLGRFGELISTAPEPALDRAIQGKQQLLNLQGKITNSINKIPKIDTSVEKKSETVEEKEEEKKEEKTGEEKTGEEKTEEEKVSQSGGKKFKYFKNYKYKKIPAKTRKRIMEAGYRRHGRKLQY